VVSKEAVEKISAKKKHKATKVKSSSVIELSTSSDEMPATIGGMKDEDETAEAKLAKSSPTRPKEQSQVCDLSSLRRRLVKSLYIHRISSSSSKNHPKQQ
jgi:hypothetical protein